MDILARWEPFFGIPVLEHHCGTTRMLGCGSSCTSSCVTRCFASALETTGKWNLQYKKVRAVNVKQCLRRPLMCQMCQLEARSLSHLLEHTRDHIDRRDTRSHLIQSAAKLGARPKHSVLALLCGHGQDRSSQQYAGRSRSEAPAQGERERGKNEEEAVAQLSTLMTKQVLKTALEIRELQTCVIRVFIPPQRQRDGGLDQVSLRRVRSPLLECFQRGAAAHRVSIGCARRCQRPFFRSKFKQAFGYIETAPT